MSRPALAVAFLTFAVAFCPVASVSPAQRDEGDLAAQVKMLVEEVRLLRLRVTELEKQVSHLRATSEPVAVPGVVSGELRLPLTFELPPLVLPPPRDVLPWNYDTGLYVFPGLDAPARSSKTKD